MNGRATTWGVFKAYAFFFSHYDDMQSCVTVCPVVLELFAINHSTKLGNKL